MKILYALTQRVAGLFFVFLCVIYRLTRGRFFFRISVEGGEHLQRLGMPVILIPTHKSYADPFYIAAALLGTGKILPVRTMAADWLYRIPASRCGFLLRLAFGALGAYPKARGMGLRKACRFIANGQSVMIYPEGFISREAGFLEMQKGAVWLAKRSGAPLLPVALAGLERSSPRDFFFGGRSVTVAFGAPFRIGPNEDTGAACLRIKEKLVALYNENAR